MHIALWDTRRRHVTKEFGAGFGMGAYHGLGGLRGKLIRRWYVRDRRPVALAYAYLAGIFRQLGHSVEYAEDCLPDAADSYVFLPSLPTLDLEVAAIRQLRAKRPDAPILVAGVVAHTLPDEFDGLNVTLVRGEPEQLLWKLDEALAHGAGVFDAGRVADLDALPHPDWAPFRPRQFRVGYDFTQFPTALVQASRGCAFTCNYCPYILVENRTRHRAPEAVVDEIARGMRTHRFRSFKFRDPLFGLNRRHLIGLIDNLGRLPHKIQFSIETRIDLLNREILQELRDVGLTSITVGVETPSDETLREYRRKPIADDRQHEFIAACRALGIRTAAGFMIGFPGDTSESILDVLRYAKRLNPTFANFNIVTPYPGTAFFAESTSNVSDAPWSHYDMYTPVMNYQRLTRADVLQLHAKCFTSYYSRWPYLFDNAHLLWPWLRKLGLGRRFRTAHEADAAASSRDRRPLRGPCSCGEQRAA
ncbi:MAG: radical SAM protein [Planctomycetales bacterium]|nr:radical SAM protein [Planctomycetales bacterium]